MRRTLKLWLAKMFPTTPRLPVRVCVVWANQSPYKHAPSQIVYTSSLRRNIVARRLITRAIDTDSWVWTGPNTIRAWHKLIRLPQGGSGTAPPKKSDLVEILEILKRIQAAPPCNQQD